MNSYLISPFLHFIVVLLALAVLVFEKTFSLPVQCDRVSFTQKTGFQVVNIHDSNLENCFSAGSADFECELFLHLKHHLEHGCSYKVMTFSGSQCEDHSFVRHVPLKFPQANIVLNERRPICSFKLQYNSWKNSPITVRFGGGNGDVQSQVYQRGCYNICGPSGQDTVRPKWVGVYDNKGRVVDERNNHIKLFSKIYCEEDSQLNYADGKVAVTHETNLDRLTQTLTNRNIRSYRFTRT